MSLSYKLYVVLLPSLTVRAGCPDIAVTAALSTVPVGLL